MVPVPVTLIVFIIVGVKVDHTRQHDTHSHMVSVTVARTSSSGILTHRDLALDTPLLDTYHSRHGLVVTLFSMSNQLFGWWGEEGLVC